MHNNQLDVSHFLGAIDFFGLPDALFCMMGKHDMHSQGNGDIQVYQRCQTLQLRLLVSP